MATIKAYTDLEQSKTLANILPLESSDMVYLRCDFEDEGKYSILVGSYHEGYTEREDGTIIPVFDEHFPAWSLTALLNYLKSKNKFPDIKELSDGRFKLTTFIWDGKKSFQVFIANNLVDVCYKLVLKLHECEML